MSFSRTSLLCGLLLVGGTALAQTGGGVVMMPPLADPAAGPDGGLTPIRPSRLRVLSAADHDLFVRAFAAAARGDWTQAHALAAQGQNPTAKRLLEWRYALDKNSGASFAEIDAVMQDTDTKGAATWPMRAALQARAESQLAPDMTPGAVLAWFGARSPASAIGKVRLGEALVATGDKARGAALIQSGWAEGNFEAAAERDIVQKDGALLTLENDRQRLDALLWRGEMGAARRELPRVGEAEARVAEARIALASGLTHAQSELDKVSGSNDPGLLFDWSRALRQAGRDSEAHAMLLRSSPASLAQSHAARWWAECNVQARDALAHGDARTALAIAQHAGLSSGDQYAEQQFLAGFIALRFLKDAKTALASFQRLEAGVGRPISKARAQYWQGRAFEALGDTANAWAQYRLAAGYPETFYGQIALAHTQAAPLLHLSDTAVQAAPVSEIDADPLIDEIKVLADLGQAGSLRAFIDRDVEVYASPRHLKRLMSLLADWGYPEIALRLAKTASYAGAPMPVFTHPVIALPAYPGPGAAPEAALTLGLIRQETEFDAYAVSNAGARGLMQMMPASAKLAARNAGLPYRPEALLSDTAYNIELGMTEVRGHLNQYGGSYVLATASYNAGPGNVRKWLAANGDPRTGTDPIDWIEQIPFAETRNYVQRVLENTEVYRARLAGKDAALRILPDLYAPAPVAMGLLTAKSN